MPDRARLVSRHGLLCRDRVLCPCVMIELGPGRELLRRDRELSIATGLGHGMRSSCRDLMLWVATEFRPGYGNRVATWRTGWHDEARACGAIDPPPRHSACCLGEHTAEGARDQVALRTWQCAPITTEFLHRDRAVQ